MSGRMKIMCDNKSQNRLTFSLNSWISQKVSQYIYSPRGGCTNLLSLAKGFSSLLTFNSSQWGSSLRKYFRSRHFTCACGSVAHWKHFNKNYERSEVADKKKMTANVFTYKLSCFIRGKIPCVQLMCPFRGVSESNATWESRLRQNCQPTLARLCRIFVSHNFP